jgi:sigma-E factor negative regulatory protein RseC
MRETITHQGVVESVEGEHVRVNILQVSACSSCKARSLCTTSESKEKIIDVYEPGAAEKYRRGDAVNVCGTLSMGKQAVRLAFGIPGCKLNLPVQHVATEKVVLTKELLSLEHSFQRGIHSLSIHK